VEELASQGYIVVTIDHTHDAGDVEFPGGRVETLFLPGEITDSVTAQALAVREADSRFVLDQLAAINAGRNPDVDKLPLPRGLRGALDLSRTGMFGHSLGGATAAATMHDDPRVKAGIDMYGSCSAAAPPPARTGRSSSWAVTRADPRIPAGTSSGRTSAAGSVS
jgi:predicted dienelactone hydrolase